MSENNFIHESHLDNSGGVNLQVSRLLRADNESVAIENGELDKVGLVSKTRGYLQRGADVNDGYNILGAVNAIKPSTGTRKQIVVADGVASSDAYTYNNITDTWTPHTLSLSSGSRAEFESFLDGFFMVNFTEATRFNNLTAWSTVTNVTNAAKAKYIKQYLSRIYLGYVVSGGSTYPSRVTYSELPSGTPLSITWDDSLNYFDVDPEDGDVIKALEVNANRLLVFKENTLHRYDTNTRYKVPGAPGTVSQRSVKNISTWTLYLHTTGVWGYNGESSQLMSRAVQEIIEGVSTRNFANSCAGVVGDHYYLYVGDVFNQRTKLSISNCLLDFDISKNAWAWRSLTKDPTVFFAYPDDRSGVTYNSATVTYGSSDVAYNGLVSSEERIYMGTMDGEVHQFNAGNSFNGTDIAFKLETKDYYLGHPARYKLLQKVWIFTNRGRGITVQFKLDDGDWKNLGRIRDDQTPLVFPAGSRCQHVRLRFLESSSGEQFSMEGIDLYFVPETLEE
jgi:hypothetical protein